MKLLVATRSAGKEAEIRRVLGSVDGVELVSPAGVGLPPTPDEEGIEIHETFEENARRKALYFHERSGLPALADDSGLVVDALTGSPGVRSKRFAPGWENRSAAEQDRANNEHLLERLGDLDLPDRTARFVCVAALCVGSEDIHTFRGEAEGLILGAMRGEGGFGYDPLFYDPEIGKTFAEIPANEKNRRSHRGKAFRKVAVALQELEGRPPTAER